MKIFFAYALLLIISLSCESNIVDPDLRKSPDQTAAILQIKYNGKPFNPQTDTLHVIPCDSMFLELKIADKDKIKTFAASQIYSLTDTIKYSVIESDTVSLRVRFAADWNLSTDGTRTYFVSFTDKNGHYYRINFIVKIDPYVVFSLSRTECFGDCAVYSIKIYNNQVVKYEGIKNVAVIGVRYSSISSESYLNLITEFVNKGFLNIDYSGVNCTDAPYNGLMFNFKCQRNFTSRQVCSSEQPEDLIYLENLIDSVTNADQWKK